MKERRKRNQKKSEISRRKEKTRKKKRTVEGVSPSNIPEDKLFLVILRAHTRTISYAHTKPHNHTFRKIHMRAQRKH